MLLANRLLPLTGVFLFCLFFFSQTILAQGQDEILLMTGKTIKGKVTKIDTGFVFYDYEKRNGKVQKRFLDHERVFSINYADGTDSVIYEMDTTEGNYFTQEEMRYYIYGEQDAIAGYKAPLVTISGVAFGGAGGYILADNFFIFVIPFTYTVIAGLPRAKVRRKTVRDPKYLSEPAYVLGYERTAGSKKVINALAGSLVGMVSGAAIFYSTQ